MFCIYFSTTLEVKIKVVVKGIHLIYIKYGMW